MAITTNFFDGTSVPASALIAPWASLLSDGVFAATDFAAAANSPAALNVVIGTGSAAKNGYYIKSDAAVAVPIGANTSGYNRIDLIVLTVDTTNKVTTVQAVQGVASSSPVAPAATANQLPLAQVLVGNNASVINANVITDFRIACSSPLISPVGAKIEATGATAPWGCVAAIGQLLLRAQYPNLWAYAQTCGNLVADGSWVTGNYSSGDGSTTFRIPDYRGYFSRSWDNRASGGIDNARVLGSVQQDDNKAHTHAETGHGGYTSGTNGPFIQGSNTYIGGQVFSAFDNTGSSGGAEARPKNIALLWCIKY